MKENKKRKMKKEQKENPTTHTKKCSEHHPPPLIPNDVEIGMEWNGAERSGTKRDLLWRLKWRRDESNQVDLRLEWDLKWNGAERGVAWRRERAFDEKGHVSRTCFSRR